MVNLTAPDDVLAVIVFAALVLMAFVPLVGVVTVIFFFTIAPTTGWLAVILQVCGWVVFLWYQNQNENLEPGVQSSVSGQ